jgi:predicted lipoprotein with Yx(FWY)xxD motif
VPLRSLPARAIVALIVLSITAACGGDDDDASTTTTTTTTAPADDSSTTTTEAGGTAVSVELTESDLGQILSSGGRTLYLFTPDAGGTPTCNDDCATSWPALVADGTPTVGDGLDATLFASATRDDGDEQVTVDGWPLYFFSGDVSPGDTNGQGVGDVWYVVGADGAAIEGG